MWRHFLLSLISILLAGNCSLLAQSQTILRIEEISRNTGRVVPVSASGVAIVDINSKLRISPNREAIQQRAMEVAEKAQLDRELRNSIYRIERVLLEQERLVSYIRQALQAPERQPDSLLILLRATIRAIGNDTLLRMRYNQYSREYSDRLRTDPSLREREDRFLYILSRYNEALDSLRNALQTLHKSARVSFSLRAFRKDRSGGMRLHIENFDLFEQGQFYELENWTLILTPDQQQQLRRLKDLANTLNQGADKALQDFRDKLFQQLPALACLEQFPNELRLAGTTVPSDIRFILERSWNDLRQQLERLRTELISASPAVDIRDLKGRWNALRSYVDSLYQSTVRQLTALPQTNTHVRNLLQCIEQLHADVERVDRFIQAFPEKYLQRVYLASDELADEVLRFDLSQIPEVGMLDLSYTGRREEGDELLIQALLVPAQDTNMRQRYIVIEERAAVMILTGPHAVPRVGLIMANPYTLQQPATAQFRFTPAAALLLKFGSRRSHFYNQFLDPGIGIVTASPDFSLDGIPEFGAGLAATLFRDIATAGWAWNFGLNQPYYFIGVNIPFLLPGMPVGSAR
ncbi:MAG: hypothetical protein NZM43_10535 [Saprospiraceae bacterium]|nr:hypothetical protein [Saprospiraceae bacterium]MDW8484747.1 hypothetical protein [Saprospiraceae bacterium]